jgi:hypothetical protein
MLIRTMKFCSKGILHILFIERVGYAHLLVCRELYDIRASGASPCAKESTSVLFPKESWGNENSLPFSKVNLQIQFFD